MTSVIRKIAWSFFAILYFSLLVGEVFADPAGAVSCADVVGINVHLSRRPQFYQMVSKASFGWVRVDFNWRDIHKKNKETGEDQFDWERTDTAVQLAQMQGLKVFATLAYAPVWARKEFCSDSKGCPPQSVSDWTRFVKEAVTRYSPAAGGTQYTVEKWGLWNEPNLKEFWLGTMNEFIDRILLPGYRAVKEVNNKVEVVGPDLAFGEDYKWSQWLKRIARRGMSGFDVFSFHVYANNRDDLDGDNKKDTDGDFAKILTDRVFPSLRSSGILKAGKKIWLTEFGWRTHDPKVVDQAAQAEYIVGVLKRVINSRKDSGGFNWLDKVFIYALVDDNVEGSKDKWGLFEGKHKDFAPKLSYPAVKKYLTSVSEQCQ